MPSMQALLEFAHSLPAWAQQVGPGAVLLALLGLGVAAIALGVVGGVLLARAWLRVTGSSRSVRASEGDAPGPTGAQARDPLTGFATRAELESSVEDAVWRAEHKGGAPVAVL